MIENNDIFLEGLEDEENKEEPEEESKFIHEEDSLQKSLTLNKRSTLMLPRSRFNIDDKNTSDSKKRKFEQTVLEQENENININALEFINREQNAENEEMGGIFGIDNILKMEDPFTRLSRPTGYYYKRTSDINRKSKRSNRIKNDFLFKKNPKEKDSNNTNIESDEESKNQKSRRTNKNESDEEEEYDNFVKFDQRPSFISRDSIDMEKETFEIEIVDSVWMTVLQVINCMIKANLAQMAYSMKELGLILGPLIICIIALMSLTSLNLILEVNRMTGQRSYLIFSEMIFGHFGSIIILICQFMSAFGGCLSFIVIFNKVVPNLFSFSLDNRYISNEKIFTYTLGFILLFYCYKQDVNVIKSAAKYAVFAILLFVIVTIIDFITAVFSQDRLININNYWNSDKKYELLFGLMAQDNNRLSNFITAVACIILSYSFHIFTFSIYGCMGKISRKQFFITTSVSVLITTIIYLICGTIGYLLYYDNLNDSILDAVNQNWLSSLLSLANVINVIMTFPITFAAVKNYFLIFVGIILTLLRDLFLCMFSCIPKIKEKREKISESRILKVLKDNKNKSFLMSGKPLVQIPKFFEVIFTLLIFFIVFWFANFYTELKVIFSITGGVMGNILSFIFPSIFYLGLVKKKILSKNGFVAVFFIIFGLCTMFICIASTISSIKK